MNDTIDNLLQTESEDTTSQQCYCDGASFFVDGWFDVNDRKHPMQPGIDCLVRLKSGRVFRFHEEWEQEMENVTHWKPF